MKAEHGSPVNGPVTSTGRWKNCAISPLHGWAKFLGFLPESEPREKPAEGINGANYDPIPPPRIVVISLENESNFPKFLARSPTVSSFLWKNIQARRFPTLLSNNVTDLGQGFRPGIFIKHIDLSPSIVFESENHSGNEDKI